MSTRWQSTIVHCGEDDLSSIAKAAVVLTALVFRGQLSINAFPLRAKRNVYSLECAGFRSGPVAMRDSSLDGLQEVMADLPGEMVRAAGSSADFALAWIASRVVGSATWLYYSDAVGESSVALFSKGSLIRSCWSTDSVGNDFGRPFLLAIQAEIPALNCIDDELFDAVYSNPDVLSLVIGG